MITRANFNQIIFFDYNNKYIITIFYRCRYINNNADFNSYFNSRIYTEVYHAKVNYSPKSELLLPICQPKEMREFLEAFYAEVDASPGDVEYVEANGAGKYLSSCISAGNQVKEITNIIIFTNIHQFKFKTNSIMRYD